MEQRHFLPNSRRGAVGVMRGIGRRDSANRAGAMLVLAAILIVVMIVLAAFAIDLGHLRVTRAQLCNAADAASLAGAGTLRDTGSVSLARA